MPGVRVRREWLPGTEIRRGVLALAVRVDFDDISTPQPDIHTGEQAAVVVGGEYPTKLSVG